MNGIVLGHLTVPCSHALEFRLRPFRDAVLFEGAMRIIILLVVDAVGHPCASVVGLLELTGLDLVQVFRLFGADLVDGADQQKDRG